MQKINELLDQIQSQLALRRKKLGSGQIRLEREVAADDETLHQKTSGSSGSGTGPARKQTT